MFNDIKFSGDFLPKIHMFPNWRTGPPIKTDDLGNKPADELLREIRTRRALETDMSPGERQAALLELKRMLEKAGGRVIALPANINEKDKDGRTLLHAAVFG